MKDYEVQVVRGPSVTTLNVHVKYSVIATVINRNYSFVKHHNNGVKIRRWDFIVCFAFIQSNWQKRDCGLI